MNIIMRFLNNHCAKKFSKHQDNALNMLGVYDDSLVNEYLYFGVDKRLYENLYDIVTDDGKVSLNLTAFYFYLDIWKYSSFNLLQKIYYIIFNGKVLK